MTLDDAVDLVYFAFSNASNGDLFVQKAPSATLSVLAKALIELYQSKSSIKVIGTRHGEKLYETLVTREELAASVDMGNYYRVPCDSRDLNYNKYFTEGQKVVSELDDYHSHNTIQLNVSQMMELLIKLPIIQKDLYR